MLNEIILKIKKINDARERSGLKTISEDDTNEEMFCILSGYDLKDDEADLEYLFGVEGLHQIRDAEQGIY